MTKDLLTTARERELGAFLVALESAGLRAELESKGPFTVFIPIDAAYERFTTSELADLDADVDALRRLMRYAIVRGALTSDALARLDSVETLGGEALEITSPSGLEVDGIAVLEADVECSNGVAHILAAAPIPPSLRGIVRSEMLEPPKRSSENADSPESLVSAQTAETIENDVRNYEADAETARPQELNKEAAAFAEDLEKTEKDARSFAEDLRAAERDARAFERAADVEATKAETLARGLETFERKIDDEEEDEDAGAFERGYERAEQDEKIGRDDFYADLNSHFAENDEPNDARRGEEDCVCVGEDKSTSV
ncbi:MAG: fasciclin domain-containing protein [Thermoguttaceae bacterium]|nr:fasciclin domain-containing protein [Thermoguttaceae bacterium]